MAPVKYEDISLKEDRTVLELAGGLAHYGWFDNHERPHQAWASQRLPRCTLERWQRCRAWREVKVCHRLLHLTEWWS